LAPCFQVPFAEQIRREANIMTAAVGLITTGAEAEGIVQHDQGTDAGDGRCCCFCCCFRLLILLLLLLILLLLLLLLLFSLAPSPSVNHP
jgi:hypothetical protein